MNRKECVIMTFGTNLKSLRIARGFTNVSEFAESLGIDKSTYRNYEVRNSLPSEENILKIATKLSVTTDALFGFCSSPKREKSEIEKALDVLKGCGFSVIWDASINEATISANHDIARIPDSIIIDMVRNAQQSADMTVMRIYEYTLYAILMKDIIQYGKTLRYHGKAISGKIYKRGEVRKHLNDLRSQRLNIAQIITSANNDVKKKGKSLRKDDNIET